MAIQFREEAIRRATSKMSPGAVLLPISYLNIDEEELEKYIKEENEKFSNNKGVYLGIYLEGKLYGVINLDHVELENKNGK